MIRNLLVGVLLSLAALQSSAAPPYARVLLPLYISQPVPGAYGSLWQSQLVIHNGSDRDFTIEICAPQESCELGRTADEDLQPNETQAGLPARYPTPANPVAGAVVWLLVNGAPADNAESVAFQLRVADLSRSATAAGTEIPVVRENDFHAGTIHLLNIPTDQRFRLALRIFEMNLAGADFNVRIFDQSTDTLLSQSDVSTTLSGVPQRFTPGFVEMDNLVNGLPAVPAALRVEIEPITPGVAFWSYVSITNNDSQQITLVTPQ
jgi:hypothetical protein